MHKLGRRAKGSRVMHTGRIAAPGVRSRLRCSRGVRFAAGAPTQPLPILMRPVRISGEGFTHRGNLCISDGAPTAGPAP
jgi:hypothetical protein